MSILAIPVDTVDLCVMRVDGGDGHGALLPVLSARSMSVTRFQRTLSSQTCTMFPWAVAMRWSCRLFHFTCVPAAPQSQRRMTGLSKHRISHPRMPASMETVAIRFGLRACQLMSVMAREWASNDVRSGRGAARSHTSSFCDEVERIRLEVAGWGDHWTLQRMSTLAAGRAPVLTLRSAMRRPGARIWARC